MSTVGKAFNQQVVEAMAQLNERLIIFALSVPTERSECSAEEAYNWTKGKALMPPACSSPCQGGRQGLLPRAGQ